MSELYYIVYFLILLFFYIHIVDQYKTSEDLEIYEMDFSSNQELQTICDVKQPITFEFKSIAPDFFDLFDTISLDPFELHIKEVADYWSTIDGVESIHLRVSAALSLLNTDTGSQYICENNEDTIVTSGLASVYAKIDEYVKPPFVCLTKYDLLMGSKKASTPMRYHTDSRRFFCVQSGRIRVKMSPFKSSKYLYPIKDYYLYEFWSPVNIWNPQQKYLHETDKIKCLEFDVVAGHVLYIPPYWWYSIQYAEATKVGSITYCSAINCIANLPDYTFYFIQQQNTRTRIAKVLEIPTNENENDKTKENENDKDKDKIETPLQKSIDILTAK